MQVSTLPANHTHHTPDPLQPGLPWAARIAMIVQHASEASCECSAGFSAGDTSQNILYDSAFAQAYPNVVDQKFNTHWETWFNQADVQRLQMYGINTVRIPVSIDHCAEPPDERPLPAWLLDH